MPASSSCRELPVALASTSGFTTCSSSPALQVPAPRHRRCRRVLYPACQRRRPRLQEAPDQALRWLLLLSALVLLQIYNEETHTCTELQGQGPDVAACQREGEGSLGSAPGLRTEEPFRAQSVGTTSENQPERVVA